MTNGLAPAGRRGPFLAREHELAIAVALDDDERAQLLALLRRLAEEQDLPPGVHPGFRRIGRRA